MSSNRFSPKMVTHKGKGSKVDTMPSRHATDAVTGGHPMDRMMGHYGKKGGPASKMASELPKAVSPFSS